MEQLVPQAVTWWGGEGVREGGGCMDGKIWAGVGLLGGVAHLGVWVGRRRVGCGRALA